MDNILWADPRLYAAALADEENLIFLYSGTEAGRRSILAWGLKEEINDLKNLENVIKDNKTLFGFFSYGLRTELEDLPRNDDSYINLPDILFASFENVVEFDHENKKIINPSEVTLDQATISPNKTNVSNIKSSMSDAEYLQKAGYVIDRIKAGDIYQANLTRKYFGEFEQKPNPFALFNQLTEISPAPYSAFMKFGKKIIVSSSPEKFLTIKDGIATTSPIKGTMPPTRTAEDLQNSEKDKAENLMIVDLMRSDLSRNCKNVKVDELFKVISHKKYHHMHSTITGEVQTSPLETVLGCFPPGSMTGTPKIEAIKLCSALENIERSVYSGALGWFDGNSHCDLSVVIRTIIIEDKKFEFQAGGAIVADSTAENELAEIHTKISAIKEVLNVE